MHSESHTVGAEQVSQDILEAICKLTLSGSTPEAISLSLNLSVQTVIQVVDRGDYGSKGLDQEGNQCIGKSLLDIHCKQAQLALELQRLQAQSEVATFIYSYKGNTDQLYRTSLVTGENTQAFECLHAPSKFGCCWSEVPGGSLLITGGEDEASGNKGGSED
jgi:hypothetical protein